jgi:hypothetical protein
MNRPPDFAQAIKSVLQECLVVSTEGERDEISNMDADKTYIFQIRKKLECIERDAKRLLPLIHRIPYPLITFRNLQYALDEYKYVRHVAFINVESLSFKAAALSSFFYSIFDEIQFRKYAQL